MKTRKGKKSRKLQTRRMKGGSRDNALKILELPMNASEANIRKKYKKLALVHHPDKGGNTEKFKKIQGAYAYLTGANKRVEHEAEAEAHQTHHEPFRESTNNYFESQREQYERWERARKQRQRETHEREQRQRETRERWEREAKMYNPERNAKFPEGRIIKHYDNYTESMMNIFNILQDYNYGDNYDKDGSKTPVLFIMSVIFTILTGPLSNAYRASRSLRGHFIDRDVYNNVDKNDMNFFKLYSSDKKFKNFMDYNIQIEIFLYEINREFISILKNPRTEEEQKLHKRLVTASFMKLIKDNHIFMDVYNNFKKYYDMFNYQNTFGIKYQLPTFVIRVYDLKDEKEYILYQEPEGKNVNMDGTDEEDLSNL